MTSPILTCFLVPKAFEGRTGIIQANALRCLAALGIPTLVLGNDPGVAEAARAHGARHLPDLPRNEAGTPRVDQAFDLARRSAETSHLCYLNADILLPRDFVPEVARVAASAPRALLTGRRWNLDVEEALPFLEEDWARLEARRQREGVCPGPAALDYFVFPREAFRAMPPFAIGRPGWDNWMVFEARAEGRPIVDLSPRVAVVHQNHTYDHLPGGEETYRNGAESLTNRQMAGGYIHLMNLTDATHEATPGGIRRRWWRPPSQVARRWALALTTRLPAVRQFLRTLKRAWAPGSE